MKRFFAFLAVALGVTTTVSAEKYIVQDFESKALGTAFSMIQIDNGTSSTVSSAQVVEDPINKGNHVLKVTTKGWGQYPSIGINAVDARKLGLAGQNLQKKYKRITFCLYRPTEDENDYKQFHLYLGQDEIYGDNDGYPHQGDKNVWQHRSYDLKNIPSSNTSFSFRFGFHSDNSVYYIDNVVLYMEDDVQEDCMSHVTVYPDGKLDMAVNNTSSSYVTYTTPTNIPEGTQLDFYTARYQDIYAPFYGKGTLNLYAGGERVYIGEHTNKRYADWTKFTGDVHIYEYKGKVTNAGLYGIVMGTNGKTFKPADPALSMTEGLSCNAFANNRVTLHQNAVVAMESGTRAATFGELNTEAGSRVMGYMKASSSSTSGAYYVVGTLNTDAVLAGRFYGNDSGAGANNDLGLIKMGTGTYTITANNNCITGGVQVHEGRLNISNNVATTKASKLSGGIGTVKSGKMGAYVYGNGVLGGTGNIASAVDNYGTVMPGDENPGTLRIQNFVTNTSTATKLVMHPKAEVKFLLRSAEDYSKLIVENGIERSTRTEDYDTSEEMPVVRVALTDDHQINAGDQFVVLTAKSRVDADNWFWKIKYPVKYTWRSDELQNEDGTYSLRLTVTSLDDDPANAGNDEEDKKEEEIKDEVSDVTFGPDSDTHSLRYYADQKGLRIGVALATYRVPLDNASDAHTKAAKEFNAVVNENELKWESCEGNQNSFNYGGGDGLQYFASQNGMVMRGHTLAWHNQLAEWVSADGKKNDKNWTKKELLAILKNHILNVVGHFKGRIREWDVVNECLDDDQTIVRSNPDGYTLRKQSVWTTVIGEEFIDSAFVWAHQADPDAKLYLNDYGQELKGIAKTEAFYNLAKRLVKDGRPIHGVGFQTHLDAGTFDARKIGTNIARYKDLGLECAITELDLGIPMNNDEYRQIQARDYYRVVREAMAQPHCKSVVIWGVSDDLSWRSSSPLPWDWNVQKKPAYYAVRKALADAQDANATDKVEAAEKASVKPMKFIDKNGKFIIIKNNKQYNALGVEMM